MSPPIGCHCPIHHEAGWPRYARHKRHPLPEVRQAPPLGRSLPALRCGVTKSTGKRKLVRRGEREAFIESAVAYTGTECLIWPYSINWAGYAMIFKHKNTRNVRVHRIVCERVHGPAPSDKLGVAHSCDTPACIAPAHLRWDNQKGNLGDAKARGRNSRGAMLPQTKLTKEKVLAIRALTADGISARRIAEQFGVSREAVREVVNGRSWAWL